MKAFTFKPDGTVYAQLSRDEALLLQNLTAQVCGLLREGSATDPAIVRLLPDAYPNDHEASAEFRRFTASGLVDRKLSNAETVLTSLSSSMDSGELHLDGTESQAWLRCLTDIRLTLASRLGIETDDQEPSSDFVLQELYNWLGFLQNSLVEAVSENITAESNNSSGPGDE
ncbi:MAG: DUF2017 domain-containing protein [Terrimesophilobacter sp.]